MLEASKYGTCVLHIVQHERDANINEKNECGASQTVEHGERHACRMHVRTLYYVLHAACTSSGI